MLEVKKINVAYGDIQAIWDISLSIGEGEIVTLIGSNGSGKSTIMKAIAGLARVKSGEIVFAGANLGRLPSHRIVELGISLVPEGRRLFPDMTVLENLEVGASGKNSKSFKHSTLDFVFDLFPILKNRAGQVAGTLSGGEQQMLAIARGLMARPRLLLIDEMSLGLSPIVVDQILDTLKIVNTSRKVAIVLVEQDVGAALSIADRGYVIDHGRVAGAGDAQSLRCDTRIMEAYLGVAFEEQAE
jgi:branched-chain amino acid transport system ATP-binding protein